MSCTITVTITDDDTGDVQRELIFTRAEDFQWQERLETAEREWVPSGPVERVDIVGRRQHFHFEQRTDGMSTCQVRLRGGEGRS